MAATDSLVTRMMKARVDRNMTQVQLAEALHVRQSMIAMMENGEETETGELYGDSLGKRIEAWIASGAGPKKKSPRGPYKQRNTIKR